MKHQQVVVDYWNMVKTSCTCLLLAFSGYILIKMVQTIFWLPGYLQNNQKRLEELAAQYSLELEEEDKKVSDNGKSQSVEQEKPAPTVTKQADDVENVKDAAKEPAPQPTGEFEPKKDK